MMQNAGMIIYTKQNHASHLIWSQIGTKRHDRVQLK